MRRRHLPALLALAALVLEAPGEVRGDAELEQRLDRHLDRATAVAPVYPVVAPMLLPPGARSEEGADLALASASAGPFSRGHPIEHIATSSLRTSARDGTRVVYTIDPELDERMRAILGRSGVRLGHVVLMDPASGEVFSYVSTAPEVFPATRAYPAASLMKVVTAAAVLRERPEAAERECRYEGSPFEVETNHLDPPTGGGRSHSFRNAIAFSNNQCFARLAVHEVGEERLLAEIRSVGFMEAPAAGHPAGRFDPPEDALDLAHLGSGLAGSFITPLAAARLAATLAEGKLVRPHWIAELRDDRGRLLAVPEQAEPRPVWSPFVAEELRRLMVEVTESGTASRAFRAGDGRPLLGSVRVSGKTGSLSGTNPDGRYQWFIGVAPAEAPRIAIATVVVDAPSSASEVAAAALHEVFCEGEDCDGSRVDWLHERAIARRDRTGREISELAAASARRVVELDHVPHPIGVASFDFPRRLLRKKASGEIVLLLELNHHGEVLDVKVDSSTLPGFDDFVSGEVRRWKFTPPTLEGRPVHAKARLPIPITIN